MSVLVSKLNHLKIQHLPLIRAFHGSFAVLGQTHDYKAIDFDVPSQKYLEIISNQSLLQQIRKQTGVVIRPKYNTDVEPEEQNTSNLLIVGNNQQIQKAVEKLQTLISGGKLSQSSAEANKSFVSEKLIWHGYKRNFKGQYAPLKPRKKCIRCGGKMVSGNPCPLCQLTLESNYEVHYTDIEILKHFICPHTWKVLQPYTTNICKMQHKRVEAAIEKARLFGYLPFTLPLPSDEPKKFVPVGVPTDRKIKWKMH